MKRLRAYLENMIHRLPDTEAVVLGASCPPATPILTTGAV
jgi:hypothetical protein